MHHVFGVHREFQFRVKSISNSHFTPEEVKTMQDAGNDAARARYLAGWYGTPHERSCSLVENTKREPLKNFIRQVFHERKFEGDAAPPPKHKHKPKPTPRIRTERSVTPHRRCRPCARRRPPRARERRPVWTRRVRFAAQGAGDNTRRSASVADAAGATAPATTAAHR